MLKYIRFTRIVICLCLVFFTFIQYSIGQYVPSNPEAKTVSETSADASETIEPLKIKLSVNEVRLDVVVLDNKGNPVTDLTAKDFEILQNGKRQNVTSSVYIGHQSDAAAQPADARKDVRNLPPLPTADLNREDTRRTIIFVVDDLSMYFEHTYYARMSLRNFVEKQMQDGDIVAIIRTGHGNSALQFFLSNKNEALARIDAMRMEMAFSPNIDGSHLSRIYDNQLSTIAYSLRVLQDMPGRKILNVITANPTLFKPDNTDMMISSGNGGAPIQMFDFHIEYNDRFSRMADDALRTGVVVNFLNIAGLQDTPSINEILRIVNETAEKRMITTGSEPRTMTFGNETVTVMSPVRTLIYDEATFNYPDATGELRRAVEEARKFADNPSAQLMYIFQQYPKLFSRAFNENKMNALNPLPLKTGGVIIENTNFFLDGIGKETESLMKGYYLISYEPPSDTFSSDESVKEVFNKIKVNVKRRGVKVYTRDGFYNRLKGKMDSAPVEHPLVDAIFSPFTHTGLDVNVVAGYVKDAKAGHIVRSWIHIDPKYVKVVDTEDGGARIELRMVCLTSDTNGFIQDSSFVEHTLTIEPENKAENIALIRKHGIRFAMLLPVKKPGFYYVRVAVEDKESGRTGSAYQSVEIPDLNKKGLALSNIFMVPSAGDLEWILSNTALESSGELFFQVFKANEMRSPALRTFATGDSLQILAMLYNADNKAIAASEIEWRLVLYKEGKELMRNDALVGLDNAGNLEGIPILIRLTMGTDMPPGDYVLQMQAMDKKNSTRREGNASQSISFTVVE